MSAPPPVSVVIPACDDRFLEPCLRSIAAQTFADFELVVAGNGLSERAAAWLHDSARRDSRIRLYEQPERAGLVASAIQAVAHARAPLVARMDDDDVAHPDRLRRQVEVFAAHPDAVLVGTLADGIDSAGRTVRPRDRARLRGRRLFSPFPHGSAMFRRDAYDAVGGYRPASPGSEDLDLFMRLAGRGRVFVVPDVLYHYRYHLGSATATEAAYGTAPVADIRQAAYHIWAGGRPAIDVRRVVGAGSAGEAARALLYGTWGRVSPATLRAALAASVRVRDRLASRHLGDDPVEWHFVSRS